MSIALSVAVSAALFFLIRLYPLWPRRHEGCDAYNILLCAEVLRKSKTLPIKLPPLFLLEEPDQWYPPGFLVLCALIPEQWLKQNYWLVNQIIDFVHATLGFLLLAMAGYPFFGAGLIVIYAMVAGLVQEYSTLNTRPFGVLLVSAFLILAYAGMSNVTAFVAAAASGILLLYSHKLATQFVWFAIPAIAVATGDLHWLVWLPVLYMLAFAVWPSGFRKIEAGHQAIVRFWGRYWPLLGAHMVRQSEPFADGKTRTNVYRGDEVTDAVALAKDVFHQNYFILPAIVLAFTASPLDPWSRMLLGWMIAAYVSTFATHLITPLRAIGMGRQYVKFGILPTMIFLGDQLARSGSALGWALTIVALLLAVRQYRLVVRMMRSVSPAQTGRVSSDLQAVLDRLRSIDAVRLMCLPVHLCDLVAYLARVPVYWGTHSHVFDERLARFFPVLRHPIEHYAAADGLTHLLLDRSYVTAEELKLDPRSLIMRQGQFELFGLRTWSNAGSESAPARRPCL
jgi:hypothetical protein